MRHQGDLLHAQRYLLLLALIASTSMHAAEVRLAGRAGIDVETIAVHATRVDRSADPVDAVMRTGVANALALPDGVWEVSVNSDAMWAPRVYARANDTVTIPLWPAVAIHAKAKDVAQLSVAFTPLDEGGAAGESTCRVDGDSWTCVVPRGRFDLRFSSRGAAPEYRFNEAIPAAEPYALQFVAGASQRAQQSVHQLMAVGRSNAQGIARFANSVPRLRSRNARRPNGSTSSRRARCLRA